ncbi:MAG: polysaccharide deacetylase family protein [Defluviitaleaceae bacterium]|nr:polysaccharide deacetylase family protein [Defluviitaleaceae bacterium]
MLKPKIALTFDDGPSEYTLKILDTLAAHNARASFFVLGHKIAENAEIVRRTRAEGSEIISHTWSHCKDPNLAESGADAIEKELRDTEAAICAVIAPPQISPKLLRTPYGALSDTLKTVARKLDYAIINWSVDPLDWECRDADLVFERIMSSVHDGAIILCHDLYDSTALAMERVVPALLQKYRLVTVSELLQDTDLQAGAVYENA